MTGFWEGLWVAVWYGGLAVFSVLSVMVTIYGAKDMVSLLRSLARRGEQPSPPPEAAGEGKSAPT